MSPTKPSVFFRNVFKRANSCFEAVGCLVLAPLAKPGQIPVVLLHTHGLIVANVVRPVISHTWMWLKSSQQHARGRLRWLALVCLLLQLLLLVFGPYFSTRYLGSSRTGPCSALQDEMRRRLSAYDQEVAPRRVVP